MKKLNGAVVGYSLRISLHARSMLGENKTKTTHTHRYEHTHTHTHTHTQNLQRMNKELSSKRYCRHRGGCEVIGYATKSHGSLNNQKSCSNNITYRFG